MKILEKDMEDLIIENPEKYLEEPELDLISRQYSIGNYRFDLLFKDRHNEKVIVEIQRGTLDRNHTYKILDYFDEYKKNHPSSFVDLIIIANKITRERRDRLNSYGITFFEIPESVFINDPNFHRKNPNPKTTERSETIFKEKEHFSNNNESHGMSSIEGKDNTIKIARDLSILFRQNKDPFNKGNINCPFQNNWKKGEGGKEAVVYLSRNTLNLLIIPKIIIDKYIFNKFYQKSHDSYILKNEFSTMNYDRDRLSLNFRKSDNNFVIIYIKSKKEYDLQYIAFKVPFEFWDTMKFKTENYKIDLIKEISSRIKLLSNRVDAIVPIESFGKIEDYI